MMAMLFEDGSDSVIQRMIQSVYDESKVKVIFRDGVGNIRTYIENHPDECIVVFQDLVPDNPYTVKEYKLSRRKAKLQGNAIVLPILGLDSLLVGAFTSIPSKSLSDIVLMNYNMLHSNITSAEKYYKYLIDTYSDCYSFGRFSEPSSMNEMFYKVSCKCSNMSDSCFDIKHRSKCIKLVRTLPAFPKFEECGEVRNVSLSSYIDGFLSAHNEAVRALINNGKINKFESNRYFI